jgi:predicted transposase/invertase (TIGR01784 family)
VEELEMLDKEHPAVQPAVEKQTRSENLDWLREKACRDAQALLEDAEERGREKGREEGREEGKRNAQLAIARKVLAENLSIETVQTITGLTREEIQSLHTH